MATDMSATGLYSFRQVAFVFLGTGTKVVCLKHVGVSDSIRSLGSVTGQLAAVLPFVVCNSLQALPHETSVGAGVV
jgi:hypothetical protein